MVEQLAYVIITPYSIRKSRTGGIISRLLSRSGLELVSGRMFAPSRELVEKYAETIVTETDERHRKTQEAIREYVLKNFSPVPSSDPARVLFLVLRGVDAVEKVREVVGHIVHETTAGETIRDTYGDYLTDGNNVVYFEPGVIAAPNAEVAEQNLKLWAQYSDSDGGILEKSVSYPKGSNVEQTLVLIKPDNFRFPNARPGAVIDTFSKTGLYIIGFKVHNMSVAEAEEFYRPVLDVLMDKLKTPTGKRTRLAVENELGVELNDTIEKQLGELLGPVTGRDNWESIVQFMAGMRPSHCPPDKRTAPGTEKCVALIYQGVEAVRKIREVLGPTDPSKAPTGTIRKEFGQTIMINAAHASDAPENAQRETKIIRINENNFKPLIESSYAKK
ncbi:MAG: nucleoside-diphosphate kinase [Chthoniobacterales bacterium]